MVIYTYGGCVCFELISQRLLLSYNCFNSILPEPEVAIYNLRLSIAYVFSIALIVSTYSLPYVLLTLKTVILINIRNTKCELIHVVSFNFQAKSVG